MGQFLYHSTFITFLWVKNGINIKDKIPSTKYHPCIFPVNFLHHSAQKPMKDQLILPLLGSHSSGDTRYLVP